jgi:hypothetical protein
MTDLSLYEDVGCRYFKKPGPENTGAVLKAVSQRAKALDIDRVLIATRSGKTAFDALEIFNPDIKVIAVTHYTGFTGPDSQEMAEESRQELESKGVTVLTCTHAFGGIGRGIREKLSTYQVDEIIAHTLRMFGQGSKVAVEVALMAADAGKVRTDKDVISIGGTAKGADTALVLQPANSARIFNLKVREIICKPSMI